MKRGVLEDKANEEGPLLKTLFKHKLDQRAQPKIVLTRLVLDKIDIHYPERALLRTIDVCQLEHLVVSRCMFSDSLLASLTSTFTKDSCALRSFEFTGMLDSLSALEDFLKAFSGISCLHVHYYNLEGGQDFDVTSLRTHLSTLRQFTLCGREMDFWTVARPLPTQTLKVLSEGMPKLGDLAIAMPEVRCIDAGYDDWEAFRAALDTISTISQLRTLRLTTWPTPAKGCFCLDDTLAENSDLAKKLVDLSRARYFAQLDVSANAVLRRVAANRSTTDPTTLPLLCFGEVRRYAKIYEPNHSVKLTMHCVTYIPSMQRSATGGPDLVGLRARTKTCSTACQGSRKRLSIRYFRYVKRMAGGAKSSITND